MDYLSCLFSFFVYYFYILIRLGEKKEKNNNNITDDSNAIGSVKYVVAGFSSWSESICNVQTYIRGLLKNIASCRR